MATVSSNGDVGVDIIGVLLAVVCALPWFLPAVRAQGTNRCLARKDYVRIAMLYGLLCSCVPIIVAEVAWDAIFGSPQPNELVRELVADFFRAALLEECFKLTGFLLAWRKYRPERKIDCILIAGTIGLTYAVVEKAAMANPVSAIIGSIVPMHILWQFNQGGHFYEYLQAKTRNDQACARKEWFMAFIVPFLLHGCWDSALSAIIYCVGREDSTAMQVVSAATLIAALALGLTYTIKTIRKVRRIAKEAPEAPNRAPAIQ